MHVDFDSRSDELPQVPQTVSFIKSCQNSPEEFVVIRFFMFLELATRNHAKLVCEVAESPEHLGIANRSSGRARIG